MNLADFLTETMVGFIAISTPIILGVTEVIKRSLKLNTRYVPLLAILLGVLVGIFFGSFNTPAYNVLAGIIAGLSASGLYAGSKTSFGK